MKKSTQLILCFLTGIVASSVFYYIKGERTKDDIEISKNACFFVWEEHGLPTTLGYGNYWDGQNPECRVFDNGRFRNMNDNETNSYLVAWETSSYH